MPQRRPWRRGQLPTLRSKPDAITPACHYRKELAGFYVCRAASNMAVVTGTDCGACAVPETVERVDCILLRASVTFAPEPHVAWTCRATDDWVEPDSRSDCLGCLGPSG